MEQINPYDPFSRRTPSAVPPQMGIPPQLGKTFMPEKNSAISCISISISREKNNNNRSPGEKKLVKSDKYFS